MELKPIAVAALLRYGADVYAEDGGGETPLHYAASLVGFGRAPAVVDALLRSGADETITDDLARCAMDMIGCRVGEDGNTSDDDVSDVEANGIGGNDIDEINRVRQLLANATADRAWRRRATWCCAVFTPAECS